MFILDLSRIINVKRAPTPLQNTRPLSEKFPHSIGAFKEGNYITTHSAIFMQIAEVVAITHRERRSRIGSNLSTFLDTPACLIHLYSLNRPSRCVLPPRIRGFLLISIISYIAELPGLFFHGSEPRLDSDEISFHLTYTASFR